MGQSLDSSFPTRERVLKQRGKQVDGLPSAPPAKLFERNISELTGREVAMAHRTSRLVVSFTARAVERGCSRAAPKVVIKFALENGKHTTLLLPPYVLAQIWVMVEHLRLATAYPVWGTATRVYYPSGGQPTGGDMVRLLHHFCFVAATIVFASVGGSHVALGQAHPSPALEYPAPSPSEASQPPQAQPEGAKDTAADQRGTEDAPLVVKIIPAPKADAEGAGAGGEQVEKSSAEWWLVRLTGITAFILLLQLFAFGWQGVQLKRTVDSAARVERAYVFVSVTLLQVVREADSGGRAEVSLQVALHNHGKTPAILRKLRAYIVIKDAYPDSLDDAGVKEPIAPGKAIGAGEVWNFPDSQVINGVTWANVVGGNDKLLCLGEVIYLDIHRAERVTGFCWEYQHRDAGARFEIAPPTCNLNHYT